MSRKVFQNVGGLKPGKSVFDLTYKKKFDGDMGQLIPVMCDEVVPGDVFEIANNILIRFNPLVAPLMHEINVYTHYYFVPNRIIDENWEEFITQGVEGPQGPTQNDVTLPRWIPTKNGIHSLWDYLGFPIDIDPVGAYPVDHPRRAYNLIYNEYYRDQNLIDEVDLTNEDILIRAWEKDYFTSALPWQQRGVAPALPVDITGINEHAILSAIIDGNASWPSRSGNIDYQAYTQGALGYSITETSNKPVSTGSDQGARNKLVDNYISHLNSNTIDASITGTANVGKPIATTFNVSDLRMAFQIQKWMERNARAGVRYTEFLQAHYGVSPKDERLQRPEYIGGTRSPVVVSEVLQTSSTDGTSPQGNLAGHGIVYDGNKVGKYRVEEFGWIIGILSVMPRTQYQQGINRQFLRNTYFDYYSPEFANLSEQPIYTAELYATDVEQDNLDIFGYQGRYNEMRYKENQTCGLLRTDLNFWHLGRKFENKPELNQSFIECKPRKDYLAVPSEPAMIFDYTNIIRAIRPMPFISEPGLIDHY
jgi:hypothetical protein